MIDRLRRWPVAAFVVGCLLPVHGILWPALWLGASPEALQPLKLPLAVLPTSVAMLITVAIDGSSGARRLWSRLWRPVGWWHCLVATGLFPALGVLALALRFLWDGSWPGLDSLPSPGEALLLAPFLLLFPGFAEEFGWRGFLQERLQARLPVFVASALVGVTWATWHTMDFLMGIWDAEPMLVLMFYLYTVGASIGIGALYAASGGSVLVAMLGHFGLNVSSSFLPVWAPAAGRLTPMVFVGLVWVVGVLVVVRAIRRQ